MQLNWLRVYEVPFESLEYALDVTAGGQMQHYSGFGNYYFLFKFLHITAQMSRYVTMTERCTRSEINGRRNTWEQSALARAMEDSRYRRLIKCRSCLKLLKKLF